MLRYLGHTLSTETDRNGNRYHIERLTMVHDGSSITVPHASSGNVRYMLRNVGVSAHEIYDTDATVGKRDLANAEKYASLVVHEHVLRATIWAYLDPCHRVELLAAWLAKLSSDIMSADETMNDGQASEAARRNAEIHADTCRQRLQSWATAKGWKLSWPGIHASIEMPSVRWHTLCPETAADVAAAYFA
jgi:hypothetical protein